MIFLTIQKKRAQAATEFAIVFSLAFLLLIPMMYMFQKYSLESSERATSTMVNVIGNDMISLAESTYYMGNPAKLMYEASMPAGIQDMKIESDWDQGINELVFLVEGVGEIAFPCEVNINAEFEPSDYSSGPKTIVFQSMNTSTHKYVNISIS